MPYTKIVEREDGKKSKVVVTNYALAGHKPNVGVDVFKQVPGTKNWELCSQTPEEKKASMAMSVSDYLKNGRHPMFYEISPAELLKIGKEARFFGYGNPHMDASLALREPGGGNSEIGVIVDTGTGVIHEVPDLDLKASPAERLYIRGESFDVETNAHQQIRVIDIPRLQNLMALSMPKPEGSSYSPS